MGIRSIVPGMRLCGEAFTVRYVPLGLEEPQAGTYLPKVQKGQVVMIENAGRTDHAIWGDIMTRAGKQKELGGVVIDGACRDIEAVRETLFPVYAKGVSMVSGKRHVKADQIQVPISVSGMRVCPGDLIFGDETGVIAIPQAKLLEVLEKAEEIQKAEEALIHSLIGRD